MKYHIISKEWNYFFQNMTNSQWNKVLMPLSQYRNFHYVNFFIKIMRETFVTDYILYIYAYMRGYRYRTYQ